jgi:hypothetical protein
VRTGFSALPLGSVRALTPFHDGRASGRDRHRFLRDVAYAAGWKRREHPGQWVSITRTCRDGRTPDWWALEIVSGPDGPEQTERFVVAPTDLHTVPDLTIWSLVTTLPAPTGCPMTDQQFAPAHREEIISLSGLRMWGEQRDTQVTHAPGWSPSQMRSDQAIRRHGHLVCCALSCCWSHASHPCSSTTEEAGEASESACVQSSGFASCQASEQNANHGRADPTFLTFRHVFVVLAEPT